MNVFHYFEVETHKGQQAGSAVFYDRESAYSVYVLKSALQVVGKDEAFSLKAYTPLGETLLKQASLPTSPIPFNYAQSSLEARLTKASQFDVLRALLKLPLPEMDLAHFNGGLIGVFGYDMVRQLEKLQPAQNDLLQDPDYLFFLPEHFIVVDHATHTASEVKLSLNTCKITKHSLEFNLPKARSISIQNLVSDTTEAEYQAGVRSLQAEIAAGNVFQTVYGRMLTGDFKGQAFDVYCHLLKNSEAPYHFYLKDEAGALIGASPEVCVQVKQHNKQFQVIIEPIAGTRGRLVDERLRVGLQCDPKELSEHAMLIDLARNDIASVSLAGSVVVERSFDVKVFPQVQHLVSKVTGILKPQYDALHAYAAAMNMGTLTGAPKVAAMNLINRLEKNARGFFGGAFALMNRRGEMDSSIIIRSIRIKGEKLYLRAAAGIVIDSIPKQEYEETNVKLAGPLAAFLPLTRQATHDDLSHKGRGERKRVLLIDNEDSFTHNLAHEFEKQGCEVAVFRNSMTLDEALRFIKQKKINLLVFSPGPGHPSEAHLCKALLEQAPKDLPIFGVCLGHQCMIEHFGGKVLRAPEVRHGKLSLIKHKNQGLFADLPNPMHVARYHSLAGSKLPPELRVDAETPEGLVMAISHVSRPIFGVQFHPESVLTPEGAELIKNLLRMTACSV